MTRTIAQDALPEFFETYKEGGMAAAVEASRKCWAAVRSKDDSRLLRYCLTFDIIASETDRVFVQSIPEVEPVEYFMPLQITTRLTAFMNKQGYSPPQVDEMLHAAVASLQ